MGPKKHEEQFEEFRMHHKLSERDELKDSLLQFIDLDDIIRIKSKAKYVFALLWLHDYHRYDRIMIIRSIFTL